MPYKIMIADDEAEIRDILQLYLEQEGYEVIPAADGNRALEIFEEQSIDMALLDIMMPGTDGFRVLKKIREKSNIPIILISARLTESDKILGLDMGADDYITKPFLPMEAVARVRANLRRFYSFGSKSKEEHLVLSVKDLSLDTFTCTFTKAGQIIDLTSVEYKIMEMFLSHPGRVFTKNQIYSVGWGDDFYEADNNIMVCISKLRSKLDEDSNAYIKTVRGLGYRLL